LGGQFETIPGQKAASGKSAADNHWPTLGLSVIRKLGTNHSLQ